jgi:hypothetical protein
MAGREPAVTLGARDLAAARPQIRLDLSFNLIQVLRLAHALVEAGCRLDVGRDDVTKVTQLRRVFGLKYTVEAEGVPVLGAVQIDHLKPECRVGSLVRPLILPIIYRL